MEEFEQFLDGRKQWQALIRNWVEKFAGEANWNQEIVKNCSIVPIELVFELFEDLLPSELREWWYWRRELLVQYNDKSLYSYAKNPSKEMSFIRTPKQCHSKTVVECEK